MISHDVIGDVIGNVIGNIIGNVILYHIKSLLRSYDVIADMALCSFYV